MTTTGELKLASIGLGWWGGMLATAAANSASIAKVYARDETARKEFADRFSAAPAASLDDIWSDPDVAGVLIATPHRVRAEVIEAAAAAGKHIFVEKPLALTVEEARRCETAAADNGVILQVGHNKRRQTGMRMLKAAIDGGDLGQLQHIETNISGPLAFKPDLPQWRQEAPDIPAGGMTPLGVHMVDTIQYLGGDIKRVMAMSKRVSGRLEVDDVTACLFELASGPLAYLGTLMASGPVNTVAVFGTDANLWAEQDGTKVFRQQRGVMDRSELPVEAIDTLADELAEFVECIRHGHVPETGSSAAVSVVEVLEAVVESAHSGRAVDI